VSAEGINFLQFGIGFLEQSKLDVAVIISSRTRTRGKSGYRSNALTLARRGWHDVREFSDVSSGAKFSRTGLDGLMREVRKGRVDAVVAYKLDRLGRPLPHLAQLVGEMTTHRVALIVPAQGIDTSASNPASQLQLNILMAVAEFEREIIRERVNSGLRAARARGVRLGRPATLETHLPGVRDCVAEIAR
jgi:DNA invertase Pin-like site-specific DNA recombinase